MVEAHFNYFDMAVIGIMLLSCLFAFFRGFVREILSLVAWVGAGVITITYFPAVSEMLRPHLTKPMAAAITATAILYVGSLIVFAIINRYLIRILKSSTGVGFFDNMLGLVFGGLRGAFIISLGYFMLSIAVDKSKRPDWLEQAQTREYAEAGAIMLTKISPDYLKRLSDFQNNSVTKLKENQAKSEDEIKEDNMNIDNQVQIIRGGNQPAEKPPQKSFDEILKDMNNK
jgi:uncharacterized membrane protein required for colicin V production